MDKDISHWRDVIDGLDGEIVRMMNRRAEAALEIGAIKKRLNMPVYSPKREQDVYQNIAEHNPGPLSVDAVRRIFERIIDEARRLERETHDIL